MFRWIRGKEPVLVATFVVVLLIATVAWVVDLTAGQIAVAAIAAVVIAGCIIRAAVVPFAKLVDVVTNLDSSDELLQRGGEEK